MTLPASIAYLAANSAAAFLSGLLVAGAAVWLFRVGSSRWLPALLALPFVRLAWEVGRGVAGDAYAASPHLAEIWDLGRLEVAAGVSAPVAPILSLRTTALAGGARYELSAGDVLVWWMSREVPSWVAPLAVGLVLVSAALLLRRLIIEARLHAHRSRVRRAGRVVEVRRVWWRRVPIYVSPLAQGAPYAGGILSPYVCVPEAAHGEFDRQELEAVVKHELAHVAALHIFLRLVVRVLCDVFWFVPTVRFVEVQVRRGCELAADRAAVAAGAPALVLASAMVRVAERCCSSAVAVGAAGGQLSERVRRLVDGRVRGPRFGFQVAWIRWVILFSVVRAVLLSGIGL